MLSLISHFKFYANTIGWFLKNKEAIKLFGLFSKDSIHFEDNFSDKDTKDWDKKEKDVNEELPEDAFKIDTYKVIGIAQSPLREKYGIPKNSFWVPKIITIIKLEQKELERVEEYIAESKYIWIQHTADNGQRLLSEKKDSPDRSESDTNLSSIFYQKKVWSLGKLNKIHHSELRISCAKIIHNSTIFDIQNLTSKIVITDSKNLINNSFVPRKLFQRITEGVESAEDFLKEEKWQKSTKTIKCTEGVMKELDYLIQQEKLEYFESPEAFIEAINSLLISDPHCIQTIIPKKLTQIRAISFDNCMVFYHYNSKRIKVFKVVWGTHFVENNKTHSLEWVNSLIKVLGFDEMPIDI